MDYKIISEKKDVLEVEFDEKTLPHALLSYFTTKGVDAYCYDEHPLLPGYRLHVSGKNPKALVRKALSSMESDWRKLRKGVEGGKK